MKRGTFDEAIGILNIFGSKRGVKYDSSERAHKRSEVRDAIAVLRAADKYTNDDDGTAWIRLYKAILRARKTREWRKGNG